MSATTIRTLNNFPERTNLSPCIYDFSTHLWIIIRSTIVIKSNFWKWRLTIINCSKSKQSLVPKHQKRKLGTKIKVKIAFILFFFLAFMILRLLTLFDPRIIWWRQKLSLHYSHWISHWGQSLTEVLSKQRLHNIGSEKV